MSLTVDVSPRIAARLTSFAESRGLTITEAVDALLDVAEHREATRAIQESFTEEGEDVSHEEVFAAAKARLKGRE
jgi:predicted transcriptional regulator